MVDRSASTSAWTANRVVALVIGIVFLIVGVLVHQEASLVNNAGLGEKMHHLSGRS